MISLIQYPFLALASCLESSVLGFVFCSRFNSRCYFWPLLFVLVFPFLFFSVTILKPTYSMTIVYLRKYIQFPSDFEFTFAIYWIIVIAADVRGRDAS